VRTVDDKSPTQDTTFSHSSKRVVVSRTVHRPCHHFAVLGYTTMWRIRTGVCGYDCFDESQEKTRVLGSSDQIHYDFGFCNMYNTFCWRFSGWLSVDASQLF
ncbi:unnamed protein product, partial [Ectocarpus sp. 13 AM-2016]